MKLVFKASSSILVCIQCIPNCYRFSLARFLVAFSSFNCFSKNMIFLSFSFSYYSTNFLNFSSMRCCSSRDILRALLVPTFIKSFSNCSLNSSSLIILFLLVGSTTYEVSTSNPRVMRMVTSDRFLHLEYFSLVFRSLKPSNSILTNTRSFQCCLMFYTTSKIDWSLNNLEN